LRQSEAFVEKAYSAGHYASTKTGRAPHLGQIMRPETTGVVAPCGPGCVHMWVPPVKVLQAENIELLVIVVPIDTNCLWLYAEAVEARGLVERTRGSVGGVYGQP
jgi:hypothetical protein